MRKLEFRPSPSFALPGILTMNANLLPAPPVELTVLVVLGMEAPWVVPVMFTTIVQLLLIAMLPPEKPILVDPDVAPVTVPPQLLTRPGVL